MTDREQRRHPETTLQQAGAVEGVVTPAIEPASTFPARDVAELRTLATEPREARFYTRYGNPTHAHAEAIIAELEGAPAAKLLASGMAALSTAVLALTRPGDRIVAQTVLYGGALAFLHEIPPRLGIDVTFVEQTDTAALVSAIDARTALVMLETPSNPLLEITDLAAVTAAARRHGARVLVDNTLATPINQRPLALGADLVVHSATKYLGGHGDLLAGAVAGAAELLDEIWRTSLLLGGALGAFDAWLLQRGLRTLAVRVERQNATAQRLAELLADHPAVAAVHYPGLPSHPQHALASAQMSGCGGLLSFELAGGATEAATVAERLALFHLAPSLGGVHSLVVPPAAMLAGVLDESALDSAGARPAWSASPSASSTRTTSRATWCRRWGTCAAGRPGFGRPQPTRTVTVRVTVLPPGAGRDDDAVAAGRELLAQPHAEGARAGLDRSRRAARDDARAAQHLHGDASAARQSHCDVEPAAAHADGAQREGGRGGSSGRRLRGRRRGRDRHDGAGGTTAGGVTTGGTTTGGVTTGGSTTTGVATRSVTAGEVASSAWSSP